MGVALSGSFESANGRLLQAMRVDALQTRAVRPRDGRVGAKVFLGR